LAPAPQGIKPETNSKKLNYCKEPALSDLSQLKPSAVIAQAVFCGMRVPFMVGVTQFPGAQFCSRVLWRSGYSARRSPVSRKSLPSLSYKGKIVAMAFLQIGNYGVHFPSVTGAQINLSKTLDG
jgi:hypothetical protein